jgi:hypothetical protein
VVANFLDEVDVRQAFGHNEFLKHSPLIGQVWPLRCAGQSAIGDQSRRLLTRPYSLKSYRKTLQEALDADRPSH